MNTKIQSLTDALNESGLVQVISTDASAKRVRVTCRLMQGMDSAWMRRVQELLKHVDALGKGNDVIIARRYFMKDGRMVFGWYIDIQSTSGAKLEKLVDGLRPILAKKEVVVVQKKVANRPVGSRVIPLNQASQGRPSQIRVVKSSIDEEGRPTIIEEFPLPHVERDLNIPNERGAGAKGLISGEPSGTFRRKS